MELEKQRKEIAYRAKSNPINIKNGRLKGYLVTNQTKQVLRIGAVRFENASTAISYGGIPLFGYKYHDNEINVQVYIPDRDFWPEIEIVNNNLSALIDGFWDIEFKSNFLKFRKKKGENFLSLDFRNDDVEINGNLLVDGNNFEFSPTSTNFPSIGLSGITIVTEIGGVAIALNDSNQMIRPNFAMARPFRSKP